MSKAMPEYVSHGQRVSKVQITRKGLRITPSQQDAICALQSPCSRSDLILDLGFGTSLPWVLRLFAD